MCIPNTIAMIRLTIDKPFVHYKPIENWIESEIDSKLIHIVLRYNKAEKVEFFKYENV